MLEHHEDDKAELGENLKYHGEDVWKIGTVDYDGYLQDRRGNAGKKFTSTYSLTDPYSFTIGADEVIPGLEQVI